MSSVVWYKGNSLQLDIVKPLDTEDPSAPVTVDGGVATGYLFDAKVKSRLVSTVGAVSSLVTESISGFTLGDVVTVEEAGGVMHRASILSIDSATNTIGLDIALSIGAAAGASVWKTYGAAPVSAGTHYGVPSLTSRDWGYVLEFPWSYDSAIVDLHQLEGYAVVDKPATGAHYTKAWQIIVAYPFGGA